MEADLQIFDHLSGVVDLRLQLQDLFDELFTLCDEFFGTLFVLDHAQILNLNVARHVLDVCLEFLNSALYFFHGFD